MIDPFVRTYPCGHSVVLRPGRAISGLTCPTCGASAIPNANTSGNEAMIERLRAVAYAAKLWAHSEGEGTIAGKVVDPMRLQEAVRRLQPGDLGEG